MRLFLALQALLAIGLLAAAMTSAAVVSAPTALTQANANADEAEEGEGEFEEESETEDEEEEEEEFEAGGTAGPAVLPPKCVLRTIDPGIVSDPAHGRLQLALRYTTESPTKIGIEYWLKGGKGSLRLGSAKRQLDKRGVLRLHSRLDGGELDKMRAARAFMVRIEAPAADPSCDRFLIFRLTAKHQRASRTSWSALPAPQRQRVA
ncbi:MAG TPA: hypothetical protein VN752_12915 [Solirubrobacterales bacterium]|nr:hypothetical protein [Solirubrobacterales bacterium]